GDAPVAGPVAPLLEVLGAVLALLPPAGDVEVVRLTLPVARRVATAPVDGDPEGADGRATARDRPELRILGQVARDDHTVDVSSHEAAPFQGALKPFGRV